MKILHTSDWHLGKHLYGKSRIPEQREMIEELAVICKSQQVDLILVAGDVFDSFNPPAQAEQLYFEAISHLTENGKRLMVVIAGNHDSPARLLAPSPLLLEKGVLVAAYPQTVFPAGDFGFYQIVASGEGYVEVKFKGETAVIGLVPYPSEHRLNEVLSADMDDRAMQEQYNMKIRELFQQGEERFRADTVNLAVSHLFVAGGIEGGGERSIQLGGSLAVAGSSLPEKAQYIALGHLHRYQKAPLVPTKAYYTGSPIQYHEREAGQAKQVNVVELYPGREAQVEKILLRNYRPIEIWHAGSVHEAFQLCDEKQGLQAWVFLDIRSDRVLLQQEIRELKQKLEGLVEIRLSYISTDTIAAFDSYEKQIHEQFAEFYQKEKGVAPAQQSVELFLSFLQDAEDPDETITVEN